MFGRDEVRSAFAGIRKPRNDKEFAAGIHKALGIRNAKLGSLSFSDWNGRAWVRFDDGIDFDAFSRAVKRRFGEDAFWCRADDVVRQWAFGMSQFTGGSVRYGSGTVKGWRDRKRLVAWIEARRRSGVAPR